MVTRRDFLMTSAAAAVPVRSGSPDTRLAERELRRGLAQLGIAGAPEFAIEVRPGANAEEYSIRRDGARVLLIGGSKQAASYAVYDFLERQGAVFGIDGDLYPLDAPKSLHLPREGETWTGKPRFAVRGLLPWPDFLNCISVYNDEDFQAYFEAMHRMRFNTFGMHVYGQGKQWVESFLPFEYAGVGPLASLDTTISNRWGLLPQRTSTYGMGADQLFDSEVFGSDATRLARDPWEATANSVRMLRRAFALAKDLGIATGIGFEPYQIPDEIYRALPPEARVEKPGPGEPRFRMESRTGRDLLERRLAQLLEAYPDVAHVYLWEDEGANWESRKTGVPLSATPFLVAHEFLKRQAPRVRLVVAGWGGVARHFEDLHRRLPGDVIFTCLSDSLGWDAIHESFAKLEGRERWPIPWLEDDQGMWLPQYHVKRWQRDMDLADKAGCQGMLGIHWRHRVIEPQSAWLARYAWDATLTPERHYEQWARTQASGERATKLASTLQAVDGTRRILTTNTGRRTPEGFALTEEFTGDYSEAFEYWTKIEPAAEMMASHRDLTAAVRALAGAATDPDERERLGYIAGHLEFALHYGEAWTHAHRAHLALADKRPGEALALWLRAAPEIRAAVLAFQNVVATRNDIGTIASMQNKLVRLGVVQFPMRLREHLGALPIEVPAAQRAALAPGASRRVFVPTRPTMLRSGESTRITIVAPGVEAKTPVLLHARTGAGPWTAVAAKHVARHTWEARLGPFPAAGVLAEWYVSAGKGLSAPAASPGRTYRVTLV